MKEKEITHRLRIDISMYDQRGCFYISSYQKLVMNMIEEHLDEFGIGQKYLMENLGISWVLLYNCIELKKPLSPDMKLTAITWNSEIKAPVFRRDFAIYDETNGEEIARGATLSTLFDHNERKVCTDREKIRSISLEEGEKICDIERRFRPVCEFCKADERIARPSMADGIGHVNNTRYGEFVYDAMSDEERRKLAFVRRIDNWFFSELVPGDEFCISRGNTDDDSDAVFFMGSKVEDGKNTFAVKLSF